MPHREPEARESSIIATVNYHDPENYDKVLHLQTAGEKLRKYDARQCKVIDLRTCHEQPELDKNGFRFLKHGSIMKQDDFNNVDLIKTAYYSECANIIKSQTGASFVHVFGHGIRKTTLKESINLANKIRLTEGDLGQVKSMNPAIGAHVDQSFNGAVTSLRAYLPEDEVHRLSKTRWAIINMWRPIKPVRRDPLAVCDWQTISTETDLLPAMLTIPKREYGGEGTQQHERWSVAYNPNHQWYFASDMQPDEALLIKCFDSRKDGTARLAPHAALSIGDEDEPAREGVELRCLVFWEDQDVE